MRDRVNILGTEYKILIQDEQSNKKLEDANGLCEQWSKEIVIRDMSEDKKSSLCFNDIEKLESKIMRHEIIHAYLGESGLMGKCSWASDEEMVDWIAIQAPKLFKTFSELGLL